MCKHREKWPCPRPQPSTLNPHLLPALSCEEFSQRDGRVCSCVYIWRALGRMAAVNGNIPLADTATWPVCLSLCKHVSVVEMISLREWGAFKIPVGAGWANTVTGLLPYMDWKVSSLMLCDVSAVWLNIDKSARNLLNVWISVTDTYFVLG